MAVQHKHKKSKPCTVCQLIRRFLFVAVLLLVLMWSQPSWHLPAWFDLTTFMGDLFLLVFVLMFAYKLWQHYRKKP
jgi:polyferredoxin